MQGHRRFGKGRDARGGERTRGGAANQRPQNAGAVISCKRSTVGALTDPEGGERPFSSAAT